MNRTHGSQGIRCVYACVGLSWYERARTHECSRTCPRSSTCVDISTAPSHRPNNYLIQHCPLCQVSAPSEPLCESVPTLWNAPTLQNCCPALVAGPNDAADHNNKHAAALIIIKHLCPPIFSSIPCVCALVGAATVRAHARSNTSSLVRAPARVLWL
jgi:hypothetical protein